MPASCPFCGATLNFGLKFCVVCGRHTASTEMTKLGGLRTGIRQADSTKRLDDSLSSSDFERARKPTRLRKHIRSLSEHIFYMFVCVALFFCAVRFTCQTFLQDRVHRVVAPIFGKHSDIVERTLCGKAQGDDGDMLDSGEEEPVKKTQAKAPAKKKKAVKKRSRRAVRSHG